MQIIGFQSHYEENSQNEINLVDDNPVCEEKGERKERQRREVEREEGYAREREK